MTLSEELGSTNIWSTSAQFKTYTSEVTDTSIWGNFPSSEPWWIYFTWHSASPGSFQVMSGHLWSIYLINQTRRKSSWICFYLRAWLTWQIWVWMTSHSLRTMSYSLWGMSTYCGVQKYFSILPAYSNYVGSSDPLSRLTEFKSLSMESRLLYFFERSPRILWSLQTIGLEWWVSKVLENRSNSKYFRPYGIFTTTQTYCYSLCA